MYIQPSCTVFRKEPLNKTTYEGRGTSPVIRPSLSIRFSFARRTVPLVRYLLVYYDWLKRAKWFGAFTTGIPESTPLRCALSFSLGYILKPPSEPERRRSTSETSIINRPTDLGLSSSFYLWTFLKELRAQSLHNRGNVSCLGIGIQISFGIVSEVVRVIYYSVFRLIFLRVADRREFSFSFYTIKYT